jgi:hypothetical protein
VSCIVAKHGRVLREDNRAKQDHRKKRSRETLRIQMT